MDDLAPPYETPNAQLYQPLSHPDSIRVLTVFECDSADDDIECHLAEKRLSDSNDGDEGYTAISYAWGDLKFTNEIWLGDQRLLIGANLDAALRHLRRRDIPIRLWVDAVCINQGNVTEKSQQVQQMRNVFSAASDTIIWLGPGGGNTSVAAWNLLERHSSWALNDRGERDQTLPAKLEEDLLCFRGEFRDVEIDVLSRPWFRRLWVFQEAVLSRSLSIQCGYRRISWDDFSKTVLQSERHQDRYGFSTWDDGKKGIVRDISRARCEHLHKHGVDDSHPSCQFSGASSSPLRTLNILKLLHRGRYLETSDARDRIFGFMGIAEGIDTNDPRFRVDYEVDTRSLYVQFTRNVIETTDSLEILSYVNFSAPERPLANVEMPSWAPCWYYYNQFVSRGVHRSNQTILDTLPKESDEESRSRRCRIADSNIIWSHLESESASMEISGRVVGRIGALTAPIWLNRNDHVLLKHLMEAAHEEDKNFILMMALWARKLTSTNHSVDAKAGMDFINRARIDGVPWEELARADQDDPNFPEGSRRSNDLRGLRLHLKQARADDPNLPVQLHLYRRGQIAANWSGPIIDRDVPMFWTSVTDDESIVDGRSLAVCVSETTTPTDDPEQAAGQLALVPDVAKEGDVIIQISGARVPFVLRRRANDSSDFAGTGDVASPTQKGHTRAMKSWILPWELIGDCVLNGFEELAEEAMDARFRLV
ncbi:hypothetical protein INS49_012051 [Diaporthe citri]|uniref:uncharacterized protein n=1 Tax=Diaporthe citri TaxID=83186 RepID=UPI001C801DBC|nr:uncharacterized protein INS49_012051 [Diaporthe citri]KAG6358534.1 hypothetical protein INS49_012051 [Diaporthe citri]